MAKYFYLAISVFIPKLIWAQTVIINDPIVTTPTQAVIHIIATGTNPSRTSPYTSPCFYRISEGAAFTAPVNDVNPALFAGSDSDARPGSLINGQDHYFVAGTRTADKAADGRFYSRALQANTQHWVGVTCGSSPEVTKTFTTQNPPLGSSYPEFPNFDSNAFGNAAYPSIDFSTRNSSYIDPQTGVLLKLLSLPSDVVYDSFSRQTLTFYRDIKGSAWSNAGSSITNQNGSTLATTTTPNAPLFLTWDGLFDSQMTWNLAPLVYDMALRIFGVGRNGAVLESCISLDGGQTCATSIIDTTLPTGTAVETKIPGNYPTAHFAGWSPTGWLSGPAMNDATQFMVNVSGHTVTWVSSNPANIQFYIQRPAGTKLQIAGTSPGCSNNLCTVVTYDSPTQITIAETVGSPVNNTTMRDKGAGFLVWLKKTGGNPSASVSFTFDYQIGLQQATYSNPDYSTCGLPITDINTDKNGNPYADGAKTGMLCSLSGNGNSATAGIVVLWIPSIGEARLMSNYHVPGAGAQHYFTVPPSPFSTSDAKSLFVSDDHNNLWKGVLN
jgi:hypothetical protein